MLILNMFITESLILDIIMPCTILLTETMKLKETLRPFALLGVFMNVNAPSLIDLRLGALTQTWGTLNVPILILEWGHSQISSSPHETGALPETGAIMNVPILLGNCKTFVNVTSLISDMAYLQMSPVSPDTAGVRILWSAHKCP